MSGSCISHSRPSPKSTLYFLFLFLVKLVSFEKHQNYLIIKYLEYYNPPSYAMVCLKFSFIRHDYDDNTLMSIVESYFRFVSMFYGLNGVDRSQSMICFKRTLHKCQVHLLRLSSFSLFFFFLSCYVMCYRDRFRGNYLARRKHS